MTVEKMQTPIPDPLRRMGSERIEGTLSDRPGVSNADILQKVARHADNAVGATWFKRTISAAKSLKFECRTSQELLMALANAKDAEIDILLTGNDYVFDSPVTLIGKTIMSAKNKLPIRFSLITQRSPFLIQIAAGSSLAMKDLSIDLGNLKSLSFLSTDTSGSSGHASLTMQGCSFRNMNGTFLDAARSSVSDSIMITTCNFEGMKGPVFRFDREADNKGYYNVERMRVRDCRFSDITAPILTMLRSGKDESTLGPDLWFDGNQVFNCHSGKATALLALSGVQYSRIERNDFNGCNTDATLVEYRDWVKAAHVFQKNLLKQSGRILTNAYVTME